MFVSKLFRNFYKSLLRKLSGIELKRIEPFGSFRFFEKEKVWFTFAKNISLTNDVELGIEVIDEKEDLMEKVGLVKEFVNNLERTKENLYAYVHKHCFSKTKKTLADVRNMYFLCAIELKKDNKTWWVALEPNSEVETNYNHFLRFTIVKEEIIWSNLKKKRKL